jgi:hypothetical protein
MAFEIPVQILSFTAASAMSAATEQFCFVELASNGNVHLCGAITDKAIGVLQNSPARGELADVLVVGVTKLRANVDLAVDDLVGPAANGRAAAYVAGGSGTSSYIAGRVIAVDSTDNDGRLVTALINCANPARGV